MPKCIFFLSMAYSKIVLLFKYTIYLIKCTSVMNTSLKKSTNFIFFYSYHKSSIINHLLINQLYLFIKYIFI